MGLGTLMGPDRGPQWGPGTTMRLGTTMGPGDHKGAEDHNGAWDGKHLGNTKGFEDKKAA